MKKNIIVIVLSLFIFLLASFIYNFIKEQNLTEETKLSEKEVIALFKNYKPLSGLNVFIGSSVKETFKYLANNLENECSLIYGEQMDIKGKIRVETAEDDILNYLDEKNIQVICNGLKYRFLDKHNKLVENEMVLMVNACNNIVLDYYLSTDLDVAIFGENPKIFEDWLKYYKSYSLKEPKVEKNIIEEEFLGEKKLYNINKKYIYHELNPNLENTEEVKIKTTWPLYGNIFFEIINKKSIDNVKDLGINNIKFRSYLSHRVRADTC